MPLGLLDCQLCADGRRIVDGEYRVDLRMGGQEILHDGHAAIAAALGVLVIGEHLDARVLGHHLLAADDAIRDGGDGRAIDDDDIALAIQLLGNVVAGVGTRGDVVGHHRVIDPFGTDVNRNDDDPGRLGLLDHRRNRLRINRIDEDQIHLVGDEVLDLAHLGIEVILGGQGCDLDVRIDLLGGFFRPLAHGNEEGIGHVTDGQTNGLEFLSGG